MRLIAVDDFPRLRFREVAEPQGACYAILSHVWNKGGEDQEPTFSNLSSIIAHSQVLPDHGMYAKLYRFCETAHADGYQLVWADMCCIDNGSSAEVSEAITSMFYWYGCAAVCYAYLKDVSSSLNPSFSLATHFLSSEWFRRGWTLQELIAPRILIFLDSDWRSFGTKGTLANYVMYITHIPPDMLTHQKSIHTASVAQRMSWAANRRTTRPEDQAYSLMGIFGVHIPVMYGEGSYAFHRLQEEILRCIPDESLLAWGEPCDDLSLLDLEMRLGSPLSPTSADDASAVHDQLLRFAVEADNYLLATSPDDFNRGGSRSLLIHSAEHLSSMPPKPFPYQMVPCKTLHMQNVQPIPLYSVQSPVTEGTPTPIVACLVLLECRTATGRDIALLFSVRLTSESLTDGPPLYYLGPWNMPASDLSNSQGPSDIRIVTMKPEDTSRAVSYYRMMATDINGPASAPYPVTEPSFTKAIRRPFPQNARRFHIKLPKWCPRILADNQYALVKMDDAEPLTYRLSLPLGYETCPHNLCPHALAQRTCAKSSGILLISFSNYEYTSTSDPKAGFHVWGDVSVHTSPNQPSNAAGIMFGATRLREDEEEYITSWPLSRDGAAFQAFSFQLRRMQDDSPTTCTGQDPTRAPTDSVRDIQVTLTLNPVWREQGERHSESEDLDTFILSVDICKHAQTHATPTSSPTRGADTNLSILIPTSTSMLPADPGRRSPLTRRNSVANISRAASAAGDVSLLAPDAGQRRPRAVSLSRELSAAPYPFRSPAVPIIQVTPTPSITRNNTPAPPTAPPPSPLAIRISPAHLSPDDVPIPIIKSHSAPMPTLADSPSLSSPPSPSAEIHDGAVGEVEGARSGSSTPNEPENHTGTQSLHRARETRTHWHERTKHSRAQPPPREQWGVKKALKSAIQRVMSSLGRSRQR
ncbi:Vegetative incompatibility protein HET-E-1 [Trametes pubescens]|uniref:Vegetative incompatibility protein HET-E-1 n=1 Tax=Trametes pubescens TaxID=154538 RepID=A0A1M2V7N7_TRAPU|nr:Vegetative incompatibility protein HET-E-1 [Trametes pubescens]